MATIQFDNLGHSYHPHPTKPEDYALRRLSQEWEDGKAYALEIELIHRDAQGRTAIVSLLGQLGAPQPVVQRVWDNLPLERHDVVLAAKPLNLQDLLPASPDYYTFMGSLRPS